MKKSYITIKDEEEAPYDILGKQIEVFYLGQPDNPDPKFDPSLPTLADLCGNPPHPTQPSISLEDAVEQVKEASDDYYDPLMGTELDVNENSAGSGAHVAYYVPDDQPCDEEGYLEAIEGCCPTGPKGETGPRGIDEEKMYPLILDSLRKFSKCQVDLSKDSACEVLADGITQKIIKYMWGK